MDMRRGVWFGVFVGSTIGGFIPGLWGADFLSASSIIWSVIGGLAGIYVAYRVMTW